MGGPGTLYIVSTPIGNLEDITLRALRLLKEVDLIAAEDTRHTRKLLSHYDIHTPLFAYYQHNRAVSGKKLLAELNRGKNVALVSDAGTPGISDPGTQLVGEALREGINPVAAPGACAAIAALSVSGLPTARFLFEGYLPHRTALRRERLIKLSGEERTLVFYLSPHRLAAELKVIYEVMGERKAVLAREVTKLFEEFLRHPLSKLIEEAARGKIRGEFTLILAGHVPQAEAPKSERELGGMLLELIRQNGMSKKEAVARLAKELKLPKREIYKIGEKVCRN